MPKIAGILGWPFETILAMTGTLTLTSDQAVTNLVVCTSGLSETLTLPPISAMVAAQNPFIQVTNKSSSGGTCTVAAASGDNISGQTAVLVSTGVRYYHDAIHGWYSA